MPPKRDIKRKIAPPDFEDKPSYDVEVSPSSWVMANRAKFPTWLDRTFKYTGRITKDMERCLDADCPMKIPLFPHQKFVKDYLQFSSPYRGLLLYHAVGTGKTSTSIAAAEILMNHMEVIVMLPASIRNNYINEIKRYGRTYFNPIQHWKFITEEFLTDTENMPVSKELRKLQGGLWMPVSKLEPNFDTLSQTQQLQIQKQIDDMISHKYRFINYNGIQLQHLREMTDNGKINIFDNKCVVIDEIHNLISTIVNNSDIGKKIYKLLMTAKNSKLILLSGTPIINYPHEIAYVINLITGPRKQYEISAVKHSTFDYEDIQEILRKNEHIDSYFIDINSKRIHVSFLPTGFVMKNRETVETARSKPITDLSLLNSLLKQFTERGMSLSKKTIAQEFKTLPENDEEFNRYFIDFDRNLVTNQNMFKRRILGAVSYYGYYNEKLYPSVKINEVRLPMTSTQFAIYQQSRKTEMEIERKKKPKEGSNPLNEAGQVYKAYSRANCNFVFPKDIDRVFPKDLRQMMRGMDLDSVEEKEVNKLEKSEFKAEYESKVNKALEELASGEFLDVKNIGDYSPKFKNIIEKTKECPGNILYYTQYRQVEGIGILKLALNANGFAQFKIKKVKGSWILDIPKEDMSKPKYFEFNGEKEEMDILLKIFNSDLKNVPKSISLPYDTNTHGELIKVAMITKAGAEGISMKNIRQVHIVEPYWNYIRIDQVIGRAVRTGSHQDLPPSERSVEVFIYMMSLTKKQIEDNFSLKTQDKGITSDEHLFTIAKRKAYITNQILLLLKEGAADCGLNIKDNHKNNHGLKCFSFPVNMSDEDPTYELDITRDIVDKYMSILTREWKGDVLITKKGNFLWKKDTNEIYDYDIYLLSKKLVKLGVIIVSEKIRKIVFDRDSKHESSKDRSSKAESSKDRSSKDKSSKDESPKAESLKDTSPKAESPLLGRLIWENNSCYIDATLLALFHEGSNYITDIFEKPTTFRYKSLNEVAKDINNALHDLRTSLHSKVNITICRNIRVLFKKFDSLYRRYVDKSINNINWTQTQLEPRDVFDILNRLYNIPNDITKYSHIRNNINEDKVSLLDVSLTAIDLKANTIYDIGDMFPERKNTLRMDDGDITQKITYENAKALYVNIERNFGNLEKIDTYIEVPTQIKTINNTLECVSLIIHYGGVKGGHYTTLIKHNNVWYEYDDMKRTYEKINTFSKKHLTNVTGVLFLEKDK